jgi:hypothetical protein
MKKTRIWCLLALLLLVSAAWPQTGGDTEKAVAALEQQWLQAQKTNNPDLLAPLLAEEVVVTEAEGKVSGKAETLGSFQKEALGQRRVHRCEGNGIWRHGHRDRRLQR